MAGFFPFQCRLVTQVDDTEVQRRLSTSPWFWPQANLQGGGPWVRVQATGDGYCQLSTLFVSGNGALAATEFFQLLPAILALIEARREYTSIEQEILAAIDDERSDLDLAERELDELPPEIGLATRLESLSVAGNRLERLTPAIGLLKRVVELDVSGNRLSALPREIGAMRGLSSLIANHNELTAIPPSIGYLRGLEMLDLEHNRIAAVPSEIGRLTRLKRLWLAENHLTKLPAEVGLLSGLKDWDFTQKRLPPRFPWALTLQGNPLQDPPPEIRGAEAICAYLRRSLRLNWDEIEIEDVTTEAQYRELVRWIAAHPGCAIRELVPGPNRLVHMVEMGDSRFNVVFDDLGIVWIAWGREVPQELPTLVDAWKQRSSSHEAGG